MKKIFTLYYLVSFRHCLLITLIVLLAFSSRSSNAYVRIDRSFCSNSGKISATGLLPVVLTPLKGYYSHGVSYLFWSSLQESNSSHFEVQRSNDGVSFYNVGKVQAKSSSDTEVDYKFADIHTDAGVNYYRLKLLDKDGRFQYSNIFMVNVTITGINVTAVYPEPFADRISVSISSELQIRASVKLFDYTGKVLSSQQVMLNKGVTKFTIENLDKLTGGFYLIQVQAGETVVTKKIVK